MHEALALRSLASLLRSGAAVERALIEWPERLSEGPFKEWTERVSRMIELGADPAEAVAVDGGQVAAALSAIVAVHVELGGSIASSVNELAERIEAWDGSSTGAAAQAAGAKLSARMIALLPLASLVFVPGPKLPMDDPLAMTTIFLGVSLVAIGSRWMAKLLPTPPKMDLAAAVASALAATVGGGALPDQVLSLLAGRGHEELRAASVRVALGLSWEEALVHSDDEGLAALGTTLAESRSSGAPIADALRTFVAERERSAILSFEAEARRAPVRMVVPLTVCMLPAFLLLGAGPIVRGLST